MASFPEPVEYTIVRNVQSVRTYVMDLDQSNTPNVTKNVGKCVAVSKDILVIQKDQPVLHQTLLFSPGAETGCCQLQGETRRMRAVITAEGETG